VRAVVLVGGFGTRLRPLTDTIPKPLLPVGHRPMLELVLGNLARAGVEEAVLAMGFRPDAFFDAFPGDTCAGMRLVYAVEPLPLDTAGAIAFAARERGIDERFIAVNGDVLTDLDVRALDAAHTKARARATIHLTAVADPSAFGVAELAPDGRVLRFVEKPPRDEAPSNLINAGMYVLEPDVLDLVPVGRRVSIERETFPRLVADGTLYAMATDDYWLDTGRPEMYIQANLDLVAGVRSWTSAEAIAVGANIGLDTTIEQSVIGSGASVAEGARVAGSVVLPGAKIGRGATVTHSAIGPDAVVGEGADVATSVLGAGAVVAPGEIVVGARRPEPS
jgi:mannose-1-phosphate guanylyltransferase